MLLSHGRPSRSCTASCKVRRLRGVAACCVERGLPDALCLPPNVLASELEGAKDTADLVLGIARGRTSRMLL